MANARCEGIVDGRMAESALNAKRPERPGLIEEARQTYYSVEFQEGRRGRRIVQIELAVADGVDHLRRQCIDINFDPELQCGPRAHGRQRLMEAQRLTPEGLIAEGIEPEGAPAFADHSADVALN